MPCQCGRHIWIGRIPFVHLIALGAADQSPFTVGYVIDVQLVVENTLALRPRIRIVGVPPAPEQDQLSAVRDESGAGLGRRVTAGAQWTDIGACGQVESPQVIEIGRLERATAKDEHRVAVDHRRMRVSGGDSAISFWGRGHE